MATEQKSQQNGHGDAGLITGLIGAVLTLFMPFLAVIAGATASILGWVGITKVERGAADNKWTAIISLVLGLGVVVTQLIRVTSFAG